MLDIILNKKFNNNNNNNFEKLKRIKSSKHFPSSNREWKSSIYLYNKNNLNLIPAADKSAIDIIKNYFSLYNKNLETNIRKRRITMKKRRNSTNKIYISNGEFKHTNNKVLINIYLFNRQNINYNYLTNIVRGKLKRYLNWSKQLFLKKFKNLKKSTLALIYLNKTVISKNLSKNIRIHNYIKVNLENSCKKIIYNERKKRLLYWYYKQIKYINKSKFTYTYLQFLKKELSILYNKQIEFNLINLSRFYLNSDILSEFIKKKISKKRKKTLRYLKSLKDKIKIKRKNSNMRKKIFNNKLERKINLTNRNSLSKFIIKKLKYKHVTGFRLEAKGRLSRRYTASRSLLKVKYEGNLLNIDSSLKGLSSVLLKGNLKSNIQYTKLASKSRIGSFGIKGWISSY